MSLYTDEDIDKLQEQVTEKNETKYLQQAADGVGKLLIESPQRYKTFGVYWWAIKEMLKKHYTGSKAWFQGNDENPIIKSRNWHKTLYRTCLAGLYFHGQQDEHKSDFSYDHQGGKVGYTLIDHDAV